MKNILLVDDDKELSQSLSDLFDSGKFDFRFLDDGAGVTAYVKEHDDIDLVMLDVNLPTMSGLEVLKEIKSVKDKLPVIVISGFVSTDDAIEAMKEGAYEYLTKPLEIERLLSTVNKACGYAHDSLPPSVLVKDESSPQEKTIVGKSPEIVEIAKLDRWPRPMLQF